MRIAIFSSVFPVLSETFVINQIVGLIDQGVEVDILANEVVVHDVMHEMVKEYSLMDRVRCVGINSKKSLLTKLTKTVFNLCILLFKEKFSSLTDILFDPCLTRKQKMCLFELLRAKDKREATVKYDNVICHFGDNGYYVCKMRELGLLDGPISTVFHGYEMSRYDVVKKNLEQYQKLFIKGELMLPISNLWKNKLIEWGCDESKIKVHRMGIDVAGFKFKNNIGSFSLPLKVVQVGRLTEKKAILDSINAVHRASKVFPIEFTVIGDGDLYSAAEKLIYSLNAGSYIHLLGRQPQENVKKYLDDSDVFLLPSVRASDGDMEGIPVALMESMAMGLITISTYHSGIPELIVDDYSGFLVSERNVEDLATCLIKVNGLSVEKLEKVRLNARSTCVENFNNDELNKELQNLL